ncbi:MAG: Cytochrome c oxidase subunit 6 [Candelaria pacifica]|nr:MAG: Cytochrome c oxidase subunit 6 [Candelaria pacifica]
MSSSTLLRLVVRTTPSTIVRPSPSFRRNPASAIALPTAVPGCGSSGFSTSVRRPAEDKDHDAYNPHHEESFEDFSARYEKEFDGVQDVFELQRNLNNAFAYDLVPSPSVIIAALRAARRVNDYPTAVRIFEGIKAKVENKGQYDEYLKDLQPLREELGVNLKEDLYPEPLYSQELKDG